MEFKVVAESYRHRQRAGEVRWWPAGAAHLVVDGSDVTLCAQPADRFVPVDEVPTAAEEVPWCEICEWTAHT
jgi:hypothetical protein